MQTTKKLEADIQPQKELLLWEKWIKIRKEETTHLSSLVKRSPADLAMNLLENVRPNKEWKTTMEHCQIKEKPTLGADTLWEQPCRLKQQCYYEPAYEVFRTLAEKGNPPIMEHVYCPQYIQETEKGLTGLHERKTFENLDYSFACYKSKREKEMEESIKKITPFRPETNSLLIIGKAPKSPIKPIPIPVISISSALETEQNESDAYALKINNTIFFKNILDHNRKRLQEEHGHQKCTSWNYYFNVPINKAGRSKLILKNFGSVAIRYCWKKIRRPMPLIPEDIYEHVFFFNKNEDVIAPGQTKEVFITFMSDKPNIYSESWELSLCNVCFFEKPLDKLIINLTADSTEDIKEIKRKSDELLANINFKVVHTLVNELINEIIDKTLALDPKVYPYQKMLLESEMFLMKNPVCYYHQTEVEKMKDLYKQLSPSTTWNLSIPTWRESMMRKEYDERMSYYECLKRSHSDFLKPWDEKNDIKAKKMEIVKIYFIQFAQKMDIEYENIKNFIFDQSSNSKQEITLNSTSDICLDPAEVTFLQNEFYLRTYDHLVDMVELIAGVLSSIDLSRWIDIDFCQN